MKILPLGPIVLAVILTGCGLIGEKSTNIKLKPNGLTPTQGDLMAEKNLTTETEFPMGTELDYVLRGVTGYILRDDKALFGCSLTVHDQADEKEVVHYDDLFSESGDGYSREDASLLTLTVAISYPMTIGHTYRWNIRVWDKRGKGDLTSEIIFKVVDAKDLVGIQTEPKGLRPKSVYVLSNGPLKNTDVKIGQKVSMVFTGVDGYSIQPDSSVSIGASMSVSDADSTRVLEYSDLFQKYESIALAHATTGSVYITIGDPMKAGQNYLWKVRFWDKVNQNSFESSVTLKVLE